MTLERRAEEWIVPFRDARHLTRARDWLLVVAPAATEPVRLAALTHDMERHFPGGPISDPGRHGPADPAYNAAHQERSARIVGDWLVDEGADVDLVERVRQLIRRHEFGGDAEQDLVQAADSLSWLETKADLPIGWLRDGRCDVPRALAQVDWMRDRLRLERARELAGPLHGQTAAEVLAEARRLGLAP